MKFVLNTKKPNTPASVVCIQNLGSFLENNGHQVAYSDWEHYENYDFVLFMSYDEEIVKAKQKNPNIKVGLCDPKYHNAKVCVVADFLLVSSIEQRDVFLKYNSNIFIYYMFPITPPYKKTHTPKEKIIIGYHGNKVHLHGMLPNLTNALESIAKKYNIEFWAIYNIDNLGYWKIGLPKTENINIKHIQWYPEIAQNELREIDIGIVPGEMPVKYKNKVIKSRIGFGKIFLEDNLDYLVRYKYSSNPGRIYVFAQNHIPVIADMFPSALDLIDDGHAGLIAHSQSGWYHALENLIKHHETRNEFADRLQEKIHTRYSPEVTFNNFIKFLNNLEPNLNQNLIPESRLIPFYKEIYSNFIDNLCRSKGFSYALKKYFSRFKN